MSQLIRISQEKEEQASLIQNEQQRHIETIMKESEVVIKSKEGELEKHVEDLQQSRLNHQQVELNLIQHKARFEQETSGLLTSHQQSTEQIVKEKQEKEALFAELLKETQ